jgi:hypothetical protein
MPAVNCKRSTVRCHLSNVATARCHLVATARRRQEGIEHKKRMYTQGILVHTLCFVCSVRVYDVQVSAHDIYIYIYIYIYVPFTLDRKDRCPSLHFVAARLQRFFLGPGVFYYRSIVLSNFSNFLVLVWLGWAYFSIKVPSLAPRGLLRSAYGFLCLIYTKNARASRKMPGQF